MSAPLHSMPYPAILDQCPGPSGAQISGSFKVDASGNVEFVEEDGIDYAAVTVQLPGGERVPFLFTVKELVVRPTRHLNTPQFQTESLV